MVLRILNVAEKPSAAKEIVAVLREGSSVSTRASRSRFNTIYEFNMTFASHPAHMVFTSVLGHLKGTEFEDRVRKWTSCDPAILLNPDEVAVEWNVPEDKQPLAQTLRMESRVADWLVLWLDCDSEGEKIAYDVAEVCRAAKHSLIVKRARFSAMTHTDIFRAVNHLDVLNERIASMVSTRQEIDLRAGSAYTRFLTTQLDKFALREHADTHVISYGPCQFPTLGIIVDRWLQIKNFVSRDFWVFELFLERCDVPFEWARKQLFDEYTSMLLYELCYQEAEADGFVANVERVDKRQKNRWRPLPLCTVELQKIASRILHIPSHRAMEIAEALYNKGLISYPRTETDRFAPSYNLRGLVEKQTGNSQWGDFAGRLLTPASAQDNVTFTWPRAGKNDDGAHPPIHPTDSAPNSFETNDHSRLYEYITKRFLASCSIDAKGAETVVQVRVGGSEQFTVSGLIVEERGYLEVMHPFDRWSDKDMPTALLQRNARIPIESLLFRQSKTQPPPLLQEADLIALMDHHHIGTDATIAEHIKKVLDRGYVEKVAGARFNPTDIGLALVIAHERCQIHLARPHMRAKQENELKQIVNETMQPEQVLRNALTDYQNLYQRLRNNRSVIDAVFQRRFSRMSAQTWDTVNNAFTKCGTCEQAMALKSASRSVAAAPTGRGRGRGSGRGRGRGRGRGAANASMGDGADRCVHCELCGHSLKLPRNGALQGTGKSCPMCHFEVVQVTNSETGTMHTVCPQCCNNPPSDVGVNPERKMSDFRCFNCVHGSCEFARGTSAADADVAKCPLCARPCALRVGRDTSTKFIACSGGRNVCAFVYWFPRNVVASVDVAESSCANCASRYVRVCWVERAVPIGTAVFNGCLWCDSGWAHLLRAIGQDNAVPKAPHPGQRGRGVGRVSASGSRGGAGRGGAGRRRAVGAGTAAGAARGSGGAGRGGWGVGAQDIEDLGRGSMQGRGRSQGSGQAGRVRGTQRGSTINFREGTFGGHGRGN